MKKLENNTEVNEIEVNELTWLENEIKTRRHYLNFPALQSFFGLNEEELQAILDKLPPADCIDC
jgi:hypothetical protein